QRGERRLERRERQVPRRVAEGSALRRSHRGGTLARPRARRRRRARVRGAHATFVAIHQVVPPASRTPPRLSSSSFFTASRTHVAPAASARRYVASTSGT